MDELNIVIVFKKIVICISKNRLNVYIVIHITT